MNGNGNGDSEQAAIRILLADSDQEQRAALKSVLSAEPGFDVVASVGDGERAARLAAQLQPHIAVLEIGMTRADGSDTSESIALATPSCQLILISSSNNPEAIRQAMKAGAREFLVKPVDTEELIKAIQRVHAFATKQQSVAVDDSSRPQERSQLGRVLAVWGPKGGVGRTFLAVNLAVSMAAVEHRRVLLMDGCLGFCAVDVALDIDGKQTILDLLVENEDDLDSDLISKVVVHHASGTDVLLAPPVDDMVVVAPAHLQRLLKVMRRLYDYVIIDTRPLLDETTVALLDLSDVILTVCNPEIASLRNLRIFLDAAGRLGYSADKIRLILNRHDMRGAIPQAEIEKVCRYRITFAIPNDHEAVALSINHGQPLALAQPGRPITKEVNRLAALLTGGPDNGHLTPERVPVAGLARLFGRKVSR